MSISHLEDLITEPLYVIEMVMPDVPPPPKPHPQPKPPPDPKPDPPPQAA